ERALLPPAVRPRLQQLLGVLRARHRQDELGAALVLRRAARRDGPRRRRRLPRLPLVPVQPPARRARARAGAGGGARPGGGSAAPDRLGLDRGARRDPGRELLLPDDDLLLLLRARHARPRGAGRVRPASGRLASARWIVG